MALHTSPRAALYGALLIFTASAHGANQWQGVNSQFWDDGLNWTQGVPALAQDVVIDDTLAPVFTTVNFKSAIDPMLTSLHIDGDPGSAMTLDLAAQLNADVLSSVTSVAGVDDFGAFVQSAGKHTAGDLVLGLNTGSDGRYTLGGTGKLKVNVNTTVGDQGSGSFNQSGGSHETGGLILAASAGSAGVYSLSGGSLSVAGQTTVAALADASFTHSAGSQQVTGDLVLGAGFNVTGRYTLSNLGQLKVQGSTLIGGSGTGVFTHTGGTFDATGNLIVGQQGTGTYMQSGGTVNSTNTIVGFQATGTVNQSGGTHNASSLTLGSALGSDGTYNLHDGELKVQGNTTVGVTGDGKLVQDGGTHDVGSDLVLGMLNGATGEYELNDGLLSVGNDVLIGQAGGGSFSQGGGVHQVANMLVLGDAANSFGAYHLSDGNLTVVQGDTLIGSAGNGEFNQSGGTHQTNVLALAANAGTTGTYDLSDGILQTNSTLVGFAGSGVFTQNGGVHAAQAAVVVGSQINSQGTFTLSDGTLTTKLGLIGSAGQGEFTHSGGTFTTDDLIIATEAGANGKYSISGGQLVVARSLTVGMGGFDVGIGPSVRGVGSLVQSGGTVNAQELVLGRAPGDPAEQNNGGGEGSYELKAGTLTVTGGSFVGLDGNAFGAVNVLGLGTFKQSGGTHTANFLTIGNAALGKGRYELTDGNLTITTTTFVGQNGNGEFKHAGGTLTSRDLTVANDAGSVGAYSLSGGTANVTAVSLVGAEGMGSFTQSGGTLATNRLSIGSSTAAGNGSYTLTDGTLAVSDTTRIGTVGTGSFTQSGGTHTVTNTINNGTIGVLSLSGGTLTARTIQNDGILNFSGGSLSADIVNRRRFNLDLAGPGQKVVTGNVTNELTGIVKVNKGAVRWNGKFRNRGVYRSDPAENLFATLIVEDSGYLEGGAGDVFAIGEDFLNSSTQASLWNTLAADLVIDGGSLHRLDFVGSDLGATTAGYSNNFAWGRVSVGIGALLHILDGNSGNAGTALYAGEFHLAGDDVGAAMDIFSNFNIYYDPTLAGNAYLHGMDYHLNGLGCLIALGSDGACGSAPVPLPNPLVLLAGAIAIFMVWRRSTEVF